MGGFDLDAAQAVVRRGRAAALPDSGSTDAARRQVARRRRKRKRPNAIPACWRRCGSTRWRSSASPARPTPFATRHRDYYTAIAALFDTPTPEGYEPLLDEAEVEIDNLRAAFAWNIEHREVERALELASSLYPLWVLRGRPQEGLAWFDTAFIDMSDPDVEVGPAVRARALADNAVLCALTVRADGSRRRRKRWRSHVNSTIACCWPAPDGLHRRRRIRRRGRAPVRGRSDRRGPRTRRQVEVVPDPRLAGLHGRPHGTPGHHGRRGRGRTSPRRCRRRSVHVADVPVLGSRDRAVSARGGVGGTSRFCRISSPRRMRRRCVPRASRPHRPGALIAIGWPYSEARVLAAEAAEMAPGLGPFLEPWAVAPLAQAALASGDVAAATEANNAVWQKMTARPARIGHCQRRTDGGAGIRPRRSDEARRWADEAVSSMMGWHLARALTTRAHVAIAQGDLEQGESDAHDALTLAVDIQAYQVMPDALEILMEVGCATGSHREAARFVGAAEAIRQQQGGTVRFPIYEPAYAAAVRNLRDVLGDDSTPPGPRERHCRSRRRSPMRNVAWGAEAAVDRLGVPDTDRARRRPAGQRRAGQQGHRRTALRLPPHGADAPDARVRQLGITSRVALAQEAARHG